MQNIARNILEPLISATVSLEPLDIISRGHLEVNGAIGVYFVDSPPDIKDGGFIPHLIGVSVDVSQGTIRISYGVWR